MRLTLTPFILIPNKLLHFTDKPHKLIKKYIVDLKTGFNRIFIDYQCTQ